jgi:hypothetical protein
MNEGKPSVTLKAGEVLLIPAGAIHAVKNVGSGNAGKKVIRSWCRPNKLTASQLSWPYVFLLEADNARAASGLLSTMTAPGPAVEDWS